MCRPRCQALVYVLSTLTLLTIIPATSSGPLPASTTPKSETGSLVPVETATETETETNANHIFNAIHSSMRQWGSSVHHNGMSFFMATVPQGTQFYHGSHLSEPVKGTEWLAFEPEHAMLFARPRRRPPSPPPPSPGTAAPKKPGGYYYRLPETQKPLSHLATIEGRNQDENDDEADDDSTARSTHQDPDHGHGWLHTYMTAKDLRLLYIDGMSAGKTQNGTLDSQDRILLNITRWDNPGFHDSDRAGRICQIIQNDWKNRIDGVIRMEAGFEIILCSFERNLRFLRMKRVKSYDGNDDVSQPGDGNFERFMLLKAVTARYHGIGGNRVRLDYENFVTAYDDVYGLDLFDNSATTTVINDDRIEKPPRLPRLERISNDKLEPIRRDLFNLIHMTRGTETETDKSGSKGKVGRGKAQPSFDWQAITDMIIQRYEDELKYLVSNNTFTNTKQIHSQIYRALEPFIDANKRNATSEISACTNQFIPQTPTPAPGLESKKRSGSLAGRAIRSVTNTICSTLVIALEEPTYEVIVNSIEQLIEYLAWSVWKECRGCSQSEVCALPMWPWGTVEDYEHPRCRSANDIDGEGERYWGRLPF